MTAQEIRRSPIRIAISRELADQKKELESFLYDRVYRHPRLIAVRSEAQARLRQMFAGFCNRAELLPPHFNDRAVTVGLPRAVGDYLAGMTDRFCDHQFQKHFCSD
jgi:dGTPase